MSACLVGITCRHDGSDKRNPELIKALRDSIVIPVCPEQLGGLSTPRPASVIQRGDGFSVLKGDSRLINSLGEDVTHNFIQGARQTLAIARITKAMEAILKERSPSCGLEQILRDGRVVRGPGVTAALLLEEGLQIHSDEQLCTEWMTV